jgi:hypothetical protein
MTQPKKKRIGKGVVIALAVLVIILDVSTTCVYTYPSPQMRELAITIGVDYPFFDQLVQLINAYAPDFHGFTFAIDPLVSNHTMDFSWALGNQTRLEFLETMGDVIPFLWGGFFYAEQAPPLQSLDPSQRIAVVDDVLAQWINYTGRLPDGVFCWQPDTFTLNYLETKGIQFNIGYCFDQYVIDYMTMRGGWQEPYYASSWNALAPNNQTEGGVVILPYVTWDWIDSFTRSHFYDSEPYDTPSDVGDKASYIEALIERTMASSQPIGYAAFSFFTSAQNNWTETGQILKHLIEGDSYQKMSVGDFVTWFKMNYPTTPTYHVDFTSPHDGQSIEWYYSTQARIARANGTVLSYVDYRHQGPDPYLTNAAVINFSQPRSSTNSIDNSLNFTLDALGGGQYRHPIVGTGVSYTGPLAAFPEWYTRASAAGEGTWVWIGDTVAGAYGEAVVGTGSAIYIARGGVFYSYRPSDNSFVRLADPPKPDGDAFKTGTALAWDFNDSIYAMFGAAGGESRRWFYRYRISSNSWEALANTPFDQGEGDALTWVGEPYNCLYATIGGEQRPTYLMRYNPSTNTWDDAPANPLGGMGDGASLVWAGGDSLYALRGGFLETEPINDFWRYNITSDTWTVLAEIPAIPHSGGVGVGGVGDGGSLIYVGFWLPDQTDYIYALSGNQAYPDGIPDNRTYRYTISTNSWERLADLPFGVGYYVGCRLGFAEGHIYAWQGAPGTWAGGGDDLAKCEFPKFMDLSINASFELSKIYYGQNTTFVVTVTNEGEKSVENPLVNIQLNNLINFNLTFSGTIGPGESLHQIFLIMTVGSAGIIEPGNYTIRVEVYPLEEEVEIEDNIYSLNLEVMPDNYEPSIDTPIQNPPPEDIQPFQNMKVSVKVTDFESGVKNVTLLYEANEGEWITRLMQLNTTTGLYETTIDGYDAGTKITYMIIAYDNTGNKAQQDNTGSYFAYTVIQEFPLIHALLVLILIATITMALTRKSHQKINSAGQTA